MKEDYEEMFKPVRMRKSVREAQSALKEAESDRARVLYSSPFRRLQRKTQVFPLEENAAVRSRLTHSLEVAHVGRFIATTIVDKMRKEGLHVRYRLSDEGALVLPNIVETACLLHDIGNPPFGHFGEAAISAWAASFFGEKLLRPEVPAPGRRDLQDFLLFDGNPQGLRIITTLAGVDGLGMNLTLAQIAATVKYPCGVRDVNGESPSRKKGGVFTSEFSVWEKIREQFDLQPFQRFPLAFLMEAADDISYCLSDIEDGIEKGYTSHDEFYEEVRGNLIAADVNPAFLEGILEKSRQYKDSVEPTVYVRSQLIGTLVELAASAYVEKHEGIFAGSESSLLDKKSPHYLLLKAIRDTVESRLYGRPASVKLELAGYTAIHGILKRYEPLIALAAEEFAKLDEQRVPSHLVEAQRLFSLLPPKYLAAHRRGVVDSGDEQLHSRAQLIIDFVAGMTDTFALSTYQMLNGIR